MESGFRHLPSVDRLLSEERISQLRETYPHALVTELVRQSLEQCRISIAHGNPCPSVDHIVESICARVHTLTQPSLRPIINATGVIIHTNLGRAPLSKEAIAAMKTISPGYCNLEFDLGRGRRGSRTDNVESLLCELTGAEAALVVNNNASAVLLALIALTRRKEVIVSRGQLVEIGGSFRMPEVMETSGAILHEVGTTNKTHLRDYANAINENTGAVLRVHQSNYRIVGFFEEPSLAELVELADKHNLPVIDDLGSGALVDLKEYGLETEPTVQESIKAGAEVACFSGDKLIGGPQAGIIVGKARTIEKIRKNPLARAFRIGKMTIAGMEATLRLFLTPERLNDSHPTYKMLSINVKELEKRARKIEKNLSDLGTQVKVIDGVSQVGSGSVPTETVPTKLLSVTTTIPSSAHLARELRNSNPPIFARVQKEAVLFDLRTIQPNEDSIVRDALAKILKKRSNA